MPSHAMPRQAAVFVETTFATAPADWDADGTEIYVIEPDVTGVEQAVLDNENIQPRRTAVHQKILGLKSEASVSLALYLTAAGVNAAEAAQAVETIQAKIMKAALGGLDAGFAVGFAGGTDTAPEIDSDPGYVAGDWIFAVDTTTGEGEFYRITSIDAGPPITLTLDRALHFIPGADDVAHAVLDVYLNEDALNNHADAQHTTLAWKVQGEGSEDVVVLTGCKPAMEIEGITAGEPVKLTLDSQSVTHEATPSATAFSSTPSGEAPQVPGTGDDTYVRLADFGTALTPATDVECRGSLSPQLGIGHDKVMGPNGIEGVHGYVGTGIGESGPALMVEFDNQYITDFGAQTKKHLYVQIGTGSTHAVAIYWPRLEFSARPKRVDEGGLTTSSLEFRAMEDTASVAGLAGDDVNKRRSPFHILLVA